jgi:hypothetical protein
MAYKHYDKHFVESTVRNFVDSDQSLETFASLNGISPTTLRMWLKKNRPQDSVIQTGTTEHPMPTFDARPDNKTDVLDALKKLSERAEGHKQDDKDYAKIAVQTNRPIAVMKAADLHLGGLDISYAALLRHYQFLLEEEGFYLQLFGDDINMMIMHKTVGARHDILSPNEQCTLIESMVDDLLARGKLLSMCWGNHSDEFTERTSGLSLMKLLFNHKVPYFRGMGYIDLMVGSNTYPMAFTHKTRFHSFMNAVHGNKRMEQMHSEFFTPNRPIAREYITAHTHYPAFSVEGNLPDDRIWYIKTGTFKTDCLYSQRYFGQGRIGVPTVVYHADRFEHICFPTPWEAYRYMTGKDAPGLKNSEKK